MLESLGSPGLHINREHELVVVAHDVEHFYPVDQIEVGAGGHQPGHDGVRPRVLCRRDQHWAKGWLVVQPAEQTPGGHIGGQLVGQDALADSLSPAEQSDSAFWQPVLPQPVDRADLYVQRPRKHDLAASLLTAI